MVESSKAQQWAQRIEEFTGSGLSRRAWCRRRGVNPSTLDYWRSRLRRADPGTGARANAALVPIVVTGSGAAARGIEIALPGGTHVRAPCGVDAAWLSALVRGLSGC